MTERNPNDELRQNVNSLKSQVQRLNNIVWVVGIIAVIFGIGGGWGAKTLLKAQETLRSLQDKTDQYEETLGSLEDKTNKYLNDLLSKLDEHSDKKKDEMLSELDKYYDKKKKDLVKYNDLIALRLPAHSNVLLSGSLNAKIGVRTNTQYINVDEQWRIVKGQ